jgi:hypothetical protein
MIDGIILVTWFYHVDDKQFEHPSVEEFEPGVCSHTCVL